MKRIARQETKYVYSSYSELQDHLEVLKKDDSIKILSYGEIEGSHECYKYRFELIALKEIDI